MSSFADYFSSAAAGYATYRPSYPAELFEWLASIAPRTQRAWDCGTGSGQAATGLALFFDTVVASDPSLAQVIHASSNPRVAYAVMTAERCALAPSSVDLVTVAQALHWFDLPAFYAEVRRVLRDGGVLAVWTYGLLSIDPATDRAISHLYHEELAGYWPPERALVDEGYARIAFPFREVNAPPFTMCAEWTLAQLGGYLDTWSGVGRYRKAHGSSPVGALIEQLRPAWGHESVARRVTWPLEVRVGVASGKAAPSLRSG